MDRFTKNAILGCAAVCAIIIAFFYVGSALGHTDITGTDSKVERQAAESGNKDGHATFYELSENGEHAGFLLAGMIGGFTVGYTWTMVFDETQGKGGNALD